MLQERSCEDFYCGLFVSYRQARTHSQLSARLWEVSGGGEEGARGAALGSKGLRGPAGHGLGHGGSRGTGCCQPHRHRKQSPCNSRDLLATQRGLP